MKRIRLGGVISALTVLAMYGCSGQSVTPKPAEPREEIGESKVGNITNNRQFHEDSVASLVLIAKGCASLLHIRGAADSYSPEQNQAVGNCIEQRTNRLNSELEDRVREGLMQNSQSGAFLIEEAVRFVQLNDDTASEISADALVSAARIEGARTMPFRPE